MRNRFQLHAAIAAAAVLLASIGPIAAQTATTSAPIYRLEKDSTYTTGCFGPCLCAVTKAAVRGTLVLTRTGSDPLFTYYKITEVNWTVAQGTPELRITGSGTYRIGGEFAVEQRLEMDLKMGASPAQHFDSGPVYGPSSFPSIDLTISINGGQACHDTLIHVHTNPVPSNEIHPYRMLGGSTFQRGCFPPCLCPIQEEQPVAGAFALVDLLRDPAVTEFAVVSVRWVTGSSSGVSTPLPIRGYGFYRLFSQPRPGQQLGLDLTVDGEAETHYDSGRTGGGSKFPLIDAAISINGGQCFDTVIDVRAAPRRTSIQLTPVEPTN